VDDDHEDADDDDDDVLGDDENDNLQVLRPPSMSVNCFVRSSSLLGLIMTRLSVSCSWSWTLILLIYLIFFGVHELFVVLSLSGVYFVSTGLSGLIVASLNTAGQQAFGSILLP
jgi:hypothetical protein